MPFAEHSQLDRSCSSTGSRPCGDFTASTAPSALSPCQHVLVRLLRLRLPVLARVSHLPHPTETMAGGMPAHRRVGWMARHLPQAGPYDHCSQPNSAPQAVERSLLPRHWIAAAHGERGGQRKWLRSVRLVGQEQVARQTWLWERVRPEKGKKIPNVIGCLSVGEWHRLSRLGRRCCVCSALDMGWEQIAGDECIADIASSALTRGHEEGGE